MSFGGLVFWHTLTIPGERLAPEWGEASQVGQAQQCSVARLSLHCVCHLESLYLVCCLEVPCHTLSTLTLTVDLRLGAFTQSPLPSSELATRAASWWPSLDEGSMVPPRVMSLLSPPPSSELVERDVALWWPFLGVGAVVAAVWYLFSSFLRNTWPLWRRVYILPARSFYNRISTFVGLTLRLACTATINK